MHSCLQTSVFPEVAKRSFNGCCNECVAAGCVDLCPVDVNIGHVGGEVALNSARSLQGHVLAHPHCPQGSLSSLLLLPPSLRILQLLTCLLLV